MTGVVKMQKKLLLSVIEGVMASIKGDTQTLRTGVK